MSKTYNLQLKTQYITVILFSRLSGMRYAALSMGFVNLLSVFIITFFFFFVFNFKLIFVISMQPHRDLIKLTFRCTIVI